MAMMNLDFSSVPSRDPIPEGVYNARVSKVEETKSKSSNNPMLKVEFEILDDGFNGRKVWGNYVQTPDMLWKMKELLSSLGIDTSGAVSMDSTEMIGLECRVKITQRDYNGDIVNDVSKTM